MDDYIYYLLTLTIDGLTTLYFSVQYIAAKKLFSTFTVSVLQSSFFYSHSETFQR